MRFKNPAFLTFILILLSITASCSPSNIDATGSGGTTGIIGGTPTPATVAVSFSDIVTGATVTSIPSSGSVNVNATVRDSFNNLISGVTVSFVNFNAGAGSLAASSASTNAAGIATVRFNGNNVDAITTITASAYTGAMYINNSGTLTIGTPPPPSPDIVNLTLTPQTVNIQGTATVTATATDTTGNAAFNTPITFDIITSGTGSGSFNSSTIVSSITQTTNSSGQVTATFYAGSASGLVTIRATATATNSSRDAMLTIISDPANVLIQVMPASLNTGGTANITVNVTNILAQAVPDGTNVTLSCAAGVCNAGTFPALITTVSGTATATFTATSSAVNTGDIVIKASTANGIFGTATVHVAPSQTNSIEFVSANPNIIGIVGSGVQDISDVTFIVKDTGGNPQPNVLVDFQLYGPTGSYLKNQSGTLLTTDQGSTNASGQVKTTLHAGSVAGPARIVATVHNSSPAITTSSGNISIGGGVPSASHFSVAVSKWNLEGLAFDNVQSTLTVFLADRFGNYNVLQGTSVSFVTDAGAIDTSNVTDANGVTTSIFRTQNPRPMAKPVSAWETLLGLWWVDPISGYVYHPSNGWLNVVVMTTGEETFVDQNANGIYDTVELFTDMGEPYLDSDLSGANNTGEMFFDWPSYVPLVTGCTSTCGVGKYDAGNAVWDAKIPIWHSVNLVFTGPPNITTANEFILGKRTSYIVSSATGTQPNISISNGATEGFDIVVSDINMNTLIAGTTISCTPTVATGGAVSVLGKTSKTLIDELSTGPTVMHITLTNSTTAPQAGSYRVDLSCDITWKGMPPYTISYPGSITLDP